MRRIYAWLFMFLFEKTYKRKLLPHALLEYREEQLIEQEREVQVEMRKLGILNGTDLRERTEMLATIDSLDSRLLLKMEKIKMLERSIVDLTSAPAMEEIDE